MQQLTRFEQRWKRLADPGRPVPWQVDYRLMSSALARVRWELDVVPGFRRNPNFYVEQTLGAIFDRLLEPPPFSAGRVSEIARRLERIPRTLESAKENLTEAIAPFARLAIATLRQVRARLGGSVRELKAHLPAGSATGLEPAAENAIAALESYRGWLESRLPAMSERTAVGREAYVFFLKEVALLPYTPEELLAAGRQEWARAVAFETYQQAGATGLAPLPLFPDVAAQIARETKDELAVRRFLEEKEILSVPSWVRHYRGLPMPEYLAPLASLGVTDDLTGPSRLKQDGVSYRSTPSPKLPYFALSQARDPRPILVHEGIPGHYLQLVLSWAHENRVRRHFYDSGPNEGIGFYAEEMLKEAGYFDDSPRTREIIDNFARLRALRVEVDVRLALGTFTIDEAAGYLERTVPMDRETAREEAASFAAGPGQAISYQIGKLQILRLLADARRAQGEKFRLRDFHDFVWKNGNVPLSLQRWELLGDRNDIDRLETLR
ncbi:MAG: DUF885 family protein [Thermoanaerobaculia bacterium]